MRRELESLQRDLSEYIDKLDKDPVTGEKPAHLNARSDGSGFTVIGLGGTTVNVTMPDDGYEISITPPVEVGRFMARAISKIEDDTVWIRPNDESQDEYDGRRTTLMEALVVATLV